MPTPELRPGRAAAVLALALLVGCGSSGSSGGEAGRTAEAGRTGEAPAPSAPSFSGQGSEEFCRLSRAYAEASRQIDPAVTDAEIPRIFRDAGRDVAAAAEVAPVEIRPDVITVSEGFAALVAALENVDFDFNRLSPELIARLDSPEFTAASDRVLTYTRDVCGIGG